MSAEAAAPLDSFTVVVSDSVDFSHDPVPSNDSEQLLFPQYFETLVRLDCMGRPRPGLAEAWTPDETGRVWTFVLPGRRLAAGVLETAPRVVSSWRAREAGLRKLGIESVAVRDSNLLVVTLSQLTDSAPRLFADPELAVSRAPSRLAAPATIRFLIEPNSDLRDALDRGADLVVTRDPAVVDYVANRAEFTTFALPWSRTYVLLQPAGAHPVWTLGVDSAGRSLARDVAQAEARAAEPSFWRSQCPPTDLSYVVAPPISPRIVYPRDDTVARGLAERIVALTRDLIQLRSVGLDPEQFGAALRNQGDWGYVLGLPRQVAAPCHELAALPPGAWTQPLIDTRAHAIVRRGSPPLTVDWDGTVRLVPR